jgi:hypothetical protein
MAGSVLDVVACAENWQALEPMERIAPGDNGATPDFSSDEPAGRDFVIEQLYRRIGHPAQSLKRVG